MFSLGPIKIFLEYRVFFYKIIFFISLTMNFIEQILMSAIYLNYN